MERNARMFFLGAVAALLLLPGSMVFSGGRSQSSPTGGGGAQANMDNLNLTGLPIVKQRESFTLLVGDSHNPSKVMIEQFEQETNVHVDLMIYPHAAAVERKNILLASGDYPDAIGGWLLGDDDILRMAADGVIIPLEDMIEKYTPNVREALGIKGVREDMTLPNGHIYSPPYVIKTPLVTYIPWINTRWLSQVGLAMPSTPAEFKQVLLAFRDKIPPVNGQKIIPFSFDPNNLHIGSLAGWFGLDARDYFTMINGQLEITVIRPEYRETIKYFADLYANGLLDPELFTQDKAAWRAKGLQGLYGVAFTYWPDDFAPKTSQDLTKNQWDFEAVPVLRAPGAARPVYHRGSFGVTTFRTQFAITDKAKNPLTILRWLDHVYDVENSLEVFYGPLGVGIEKLPNGQYRKIDPSGWTEAKKEQYLWDNLYVQALPKFVRPNLTVLPPAGRAPDYSPEDIADALYGSYLTTEMVPAIWLSGDAARRSSTIEQAVTSYIKQKQAEWVSGQASIDAEWARFLTELDRLGIQELLQIKRNAIRR